MPGWLTTSEPVPTTGRKCLVFKFTDVVVAIRWDLLRQQRGLMLGDERIDDLIQRLALHDLGQLVEGQIDAMVAHATLRKVVGADALGPVA